ncbi:MAG TPA: S8 family serine peptidase [Thermoanaerobaculia bacterium]|nr:S8 family serine peptidase [Thermoanaerobaculia bacterium]
MTSSIRAFLGAALCASAILVSAAPAQYYERRGLPEDSSRVIVEFHGTPAAIARGGKAVAAQHAELFARFRADLAGGNGSVSMDAAPAPRIAHEYRTVFLGVAVEADQAAVDRIRALPYVRAVHRDVLMHASSTPAAAPLATVVDARTRVNASSLGTSGSGIVVAVIDTGIDYTHPALGGGMGAGFKVIGGRDFINRDDDPMDDNGHGTHVAGTIAASAPDLIGVAPDVTLIGYKVLAADGSGPTSGIIAAIERCADPNGDGDPSDRVDVANLSLGGPGDAEDPASRAVDNAVAAGVMMVIAAGNDGATASIGSPGTALGALTVAAIDDDGRVTDFSSRGPAPRLLGFKPDVSAPGYEVISARLGGGTIALNGTSMATPHVAGVAALLRKLHPEWTPAEIKAAITSSATAVTAAPFARGAGRADAKAAHESKLLVGSSGLSFGIRASRTGATKESQTFRLTNQTTAAQSLSIAPGTVPAGVVVRVTPATLQLPAGASAEVSVEVETTNDTLAFPADSMLGGDIRITGNSTRSLAWAFLRTARARMTFDGFATYFVALGPGGARSNPIRDPQSAEVFLAPGRWDFVLTAYSGGTRTDTFLVKADVDIDSDHQLDFRASDATLELVYDGRDESGRSLTARSNADAQLLHFIGRRIFWASGSDQFSMFLANKRREARRILFSPLPERFRLYAFEQAIDFRRAQSYTIEHPVLQGLSETATLSAGGSELLEATVRWQESPLTVCAYEAMTSILNISATDCFDGPALATSTFVHRSNNERFALAHNGMIFRADGIETQALRARDNRFLLSSQITPPSTVEQFPSGGTLTLGTGPVYPFALPGTRAAAWFRVPPAGFTTAAGSLVSGGSGMEWTTYDAAGVRLASGSWRGTEGGEAPPTPLPQSKLVAQRHDLRAAGRLTRGTLETTFGTSSDLDAPTLTSMRVVDSQGRTTDRLSTGDAAVLQFSVADLDYLRAATALPTRPESTRAWFRIAGTGTWQPLSVTITGSEAGNTNTLGHIPAGDLYSASLASATAIPNVRLDLRVEFADPAGNSVRWTHEGAVMVGTPVETGGRRRSVRK